MPHGDSGVRLRGGARSGLTLLEVLIALALFATVVWLIVPKPDPARKRGWRLACAAKLLELHKGALAYQNSNGCFPLAWAVNGPSVAEDLSNLSFFRFAIHENCDPSFRHAVSRLDVERSGTPLDARQQKYRQTAFFWRCPMKGWTSDYFAPDIIFRKGGAPAREAELIRDVSPADRPLFADVNASLPMPDVKHLEEPGHHHELLTGFSIVPDAGTDVFVGAGPSLRVDGQPSSTRFDFRHDRAANVLFLDGHADAFQADEAPRLDAVYRHWNHLVPPGAK